MSVTSVPEKVRTRLWGKAAGRCQYEGCNKPLWIDELTKFEFNQSYVAHIIADKPGGPRGDTELSELLKADISNLMLMCDTHHRLIDKEDIAGHPPELLREMKRKHEDRIELLTDFKEEKQSHVLLYGANIGEHSAYASLAKAAHAMLPERFPAEKPAFELSLNNSLFQDHEEEFWGMERENLRRQFIQRVQPRLAQGDISHLSIFALAPQALLIELGRLLSDIPAADVYQLHREPSNWRWQDSPEDFEYIIKQPSAVQSGAVAVNLSLSATINDSRITSVLGDDTSIWTVTIREPNNDFMKSREQLSQFRKVFRRLLDEIKAQRGRDAVLHVFPAAPVSVAVEMGRVWMPKADLPMRIYDENRDKGGFKEALDIPG